MKPKMNYFTHRKPVEAVKHPKSDEEAKRIRDIVSHNLLFKDLDEKQTNV